MPNVSSVPAVKAALLVMLKAALPTLDALSAVTWAHPGERIQKEAVFMGDAQDFAEQVAAMRPAPHPHNEEYVIPVWVDVLSDGNDPQTSETRMWTLVGAVETAIRNDPSLGGTVLQGVIEAEAKTPQNYQTDQAWASRCPVHVRVLARI